MAMKRIAWKWFGYVSAVCLFAAAVAPDVFHESPQIHPWIFLLALAWCFLLFTGSFDS
jgi:hypothetical protein